MIERQTDHSEEVERIDSPRYRVNFWSRPSEVMAWNLDAYLLDDALDADEVMVWVKSNAAGRIYQVFVVLPLGSVEEGVLVTLVGKDPNRSG